MQPITSLPSALATDRTAVLLQESRVRIYEKTDHLFARLMLVQWLAGIVAALLISPRTWIGATSTIHIHVWAATFLGGAIASLPLFLAWKQPGRVVNRHVIAVAQMLSSGLLIHLSGGRIETHFHIFGSLAFLAFYRDWRVLMTATVVTAADHILRGWLWPQSIFGVFTPTHWRWIEHASWVVFADIFLLISIRLSNREMGEVAQRSELETAAQRLAQAQEVTQTGSWEWAAETDAATWSAENFRLFGLAPAAGTVTREFQLSCVHPDDRAAARAWTEQAMRTGEVAPTDFRIVRPDAEVRLLHLRATSEFGQQGKVSRILGTSQDVTEARRAELELRTANEALAKEVVERQRAEAEIRALQSQHELILNSISEGIQWIDKDSRIIFENPAATRMLGRDAAELIGRPAHAAMHHRRADGTPDPHPECLICAGLRDGQAAAGIKEVFWRKDGTSFPVEYTSSPARDPAGEIAGTVVVFTDISERRANEEKLLRQQTELRVLFDLMPAMIWFKDTENGILRVNRRVADAAGKTVEEIEGKPTIEVYPEESAQFYADDLEVIRSGEPKLGYVERMPGSEGQELWVQTDKVPYRDQLGNVVGIVVMAQDVTARQRADEALRESEHAQREIASQLESERARLIAAQAVAKVGSWETDLTTMVVTWSAETYRIFATDPDHFRGTHAEFLTLVHPEDRAAVKAAFADSVGKQGPCAIEHRLLLPDGRTTFVEERWQRFYDDQGQPVRAVGTCHDISERKRSEQVIERTLQRLNAAQEIAQIGDWEWDLATQAITWSPEVFAIVGRDPSLGQPRNYEEVAASYDASSQALMQEKVCRAIASGETQKYELVAQRPDGRRVQVQAMAVPRKNDNGEVLGLFGTIQNITERKQADETRARLAAIVDSSSDAIVGKTLEGIITSWNAGAERLFGYRAEEIMGQPSAMIIPPDRRGEEAEFLERLRREEGVEHFESVHVAKDGRRIEVSLSISPVRDAAGRLIGVSKIARDVTERKHAEAELLRSREAVQKLNADLEQRVVQRTEEFLAAAAEAARANRAKSEFLSRTSHELRTPLNAILGFGQLLEMEESFGAEPRGSVEQILHAGRHLLSLVNEVLDISNAESGVMTLALEPVPVDRLITETLTLVRSLERTLKIEVERVSPLGGGWKVLADPQRLKQVLLNLLSNAIKYNRPSGKVVVEFAPIEGADPPVFRFSVQDTGPGISPEKLPRLFTPFDRLDAERSKVHIAGTGLGLALAKRMVELMGGRIGVESVIGEGSTFWVEVPLAESPAAAIEQSGPIPDPASASVHSRTLLYIEDTVSISGWSPASWRGGRRSTCSPLRRGRWGWKWRSSIVRI